MKVFTVLTILALVDATYSQEPDLSGPLDVSDPLNTPDCSTLEKMDRLRCAFPECKAMTKLSQRTECYYDSVHGWAMDYPAQACEKFPNHMCEQVEEGFQECDQKRFHALKLLCVADKLINPTTDDDTKKDGTKKDGTKKDGTKAKEDGTKAKEDGTKDDDTRPKKMVLPKIVLPEMVLPKKDGTPREGTKKDGTPDNDTKKGDTEEDVKEEDVKGDEVKGEDVDEEDVDEEDVDEDEEKEDEEKEDEEKDEEDKDADDA